MAKEELVPITREYLREIYRSYSLEGIDGSLLEKVEKMGGISEGWGVIGEEIDLEEISLEPPKHLDRNMYFNRWQCEEIAYKVGVAKELCKAEERDILDGVASKALETANGFEEFQRKQAKSVSDLVDGFLPNDMRSVVLKKVQARREAKNKAVVDAHIQSGGSISGKFDIYWQQQWDRRATLADLGNASGVYKAFIKIISGCPQVLLDFAKQINAPLGPTEEIRIKFGPYLYNLTRIANQIHILVSCILAVLERGDVEMERKMREFGAFEVLEGAGDMYASEAKRYLEFMDELMANSPFFATAESVAKTTKTTVIKEDPFREVTLARGYPQEEVLNLERSGAIVWQFTVTKETEFTIKDDAGSSVYGPVLINQVGVMEEGSLPMLEEGKYTAVWDSKAGILRRVTLCYRVSLMTENDEEGGMDWGAELLARSGGGTLSSLSGSGSTKGVAKIASLATKTKIEKMR